MTTNFRRTFGDAASPLPLSYLDENFSQLENTSTSTVTLAGAGLVGYIASGSGAPGTVQSAISQLAINVKQPPYSATGDGTTDDSAAIQAALDALSSGGQVYFPRGTYIIGTTLTPNSKTRMYGEGWLSVLKKKASQTTQVISVDSKTDIIIENLKIDGNKANQSVGNENRMGIYAPDVDGLIVRNCYITGTSHAGCYTRNTAQNVLIEGNVFYDCGQDTGSAFPAIYCTGIDGKSRGIRILGNHIENCRDAIGLRSGGGSEGTAIALLHFVVSNNVLMHNANNIVFSHLGTSTISGNQIFNDASVRAVGTNGLIDCQGNSAHITVSGNTMSVTTGVDAVSFQNQITDSAVVGNIVNIAKFGVAIAGSSTARITVSGNAIHNCDSNGIVVDTSASYVTITGNMLSHDSASKTNIQAQNSANNIIIAGNIVKGGGSSGTGIAVFGGTAGSPATTNIIVQDTNNISGFQTNRAEFTLISSDTTPDVSVGDKFFAANGSGTTITMFDGGRQGQIITLLFTNGNTTLQHGSGLNLAGGANFTGTSNDVMQLIFDGTGNWQEVCRSVNG